MLAALAAACSTGTGTGPLPSNTVLLMDTLPFDDLVLAYDSLAHVPFDTALIVAAGTQFCMAFDRNRLAGDLFTTVTLKSFSSPTGYVLGKAALNVGNFSWTWDGGLTVPRIAKRC